MKIVTHYLLFYQQIIFIRRNSIGNSIENCKLKIYSICISIKMKTEFPKICISNLNFVCFEKSFKNQKQFFFVSERSRDNTF